MAVRNLRGRTQAPVVQLRKNHDGSIPPEELERAFDLLQQLFSRIAGGLSLGTGESSSIAGNSYAQFIDYTFTNANQTYSIPHGLGKRPIGYQVVLVDAACSVYDPNFGAAWGERVITLACDTAGTKVKLLVLA